MHVDALDFPYGAELGAAQFDVHVAVKLFMCDGKISAIWGDSFVSVKWDDGRMSPPVLQGNPMALVQRTGVVRIDPTWGQYAHDHGWTNVPFNAQLEMSNHDRIRVQGLDSFFSIIDPSKPESIPPGNFGPILSSRVDAVPACGFETPIPPTCTNFGTMIMEVEDWVPILPIAKKWTNTIAAYNYTATSVLPNGRFELRHNIDLHNGVRGVLLDAGNNDAQGFANRITTFDPTVMGPGKFNEAFFWTQTLTSQTVSSLVVVSVSVDPNAPPPTNICTDPAAINKGGPLPCVFPSTDPTITFQDVMGVFKRQFINGVAQPVFRFCLSGMMSACFTVPMVPVP